MDNFVEKHNMEKNYGCCVTLA